MNEKIFYSQIIKAKDGNLIPLCKNAETGQESSLHSKYNPIREAGGFAEAADESCNFFIVLGLAGGYHIEKLLEKVHEAKIFAIENTDSDIDFLMRIPLVKKLSSDKRVIISDSAHIEENLLSYYKPAIHGNITILSLRQWESLFSENASRIREKINATIKLLAADYSVQSHFGKIWQKNILSNLSLAEKTLPFQEIKNLADTTKTAAIIAAGPSLNESIKKLKEGKYFIIATDTAFSALSKQGIQSDAVVSIDGQQVSHQHYMEKFTDKTIFVFDLCANATSVRKAVQNSKKVLLAETGHPLAQYAALYTGKRSFVHLDAGSGTVTIAAASLAKKLGFARVEFFGADFSYINGIPYARGTYFESQFYSRANRFLTAEQYYTAIMYRTETIRLTENKISTEILQAYKKSLEEFTENSAEKIDYKDGEQNEKFSLKGFKSQYCKDLKSTFRSEHDFDENSYAFTTLLPLCAKLGKNSAFLAYLKTLRYTESI